MALAVAAAAKADTGADGTPIVIPDTKTPEQLAADAATATAAAAVTAAAAAPPAEKTAAEVETERKAAEALAAAKPPEKYDLTLPEGSQDYLDKDDLATISERAKDRGWTNDEAQAAVKDIADALTAQSAAFRAQTEADPEYGGDNLLDTQRLARLAFEKVRPATHPRYAAITRILTKTGYGNHVEVLALLADIGKMMTEDRPLIGGVHDGHSGKDPADVLYGAAKA